jgi:hypothetical protein
MPVSRKPVASASRRAMGNWRRLSAGEPDVNKGEGFGTESKVLLRAIIEGVDLVQSLIRDRLAAVEVVNSVRS